MRHGSTWQTQYASSTIYSMPELKRNAALLPKVANSHFRNQPLVHKSRGNAELVARVSRDFVETQTRDLNRGSLWSSVKGGQSWRRQAPRVHVTLRPFSPHSHRPD